MKEKQSLQFWETPFSNIMFPSNRIIIKKRESDEIIMIVVSPNGIDSYPKYIIDFGKVIAFLSMEEAYRPNRGYEEIVVDIKDKCTYRWINSPWITSYIQGKELFENDEVKILTHYLIFGGDDNVEVLTFNIPKITEIKEKTIIEEVFEL